MALGLYDLKLKVCAKIHFRFRNYRFIGSRHLGSQDLRVRL